MTLGGEKSRVAIAEQVGQVIGLPTSAIFRQASNSPQSEQQNSYSGITFFPQN
ncbi:MAG: hypothetical protein WBA57_25050 [Elainellaceae cyanobacterium]